MPRARGTRPLVFLTIGTLKYGFRAAASSVPHAAALGHEAYTDQAGVVFGANAPKPNRASKVLTSGTVSSFCDSSKEDTLRADEWTIVRYSRRSGITNTPRSRTVFVEMPGGYNYAWNITRDDLDLAADLGFAEATGATGNLVFGSSPKPPRATRMIAGQRHSTFMKPTRAQRTAAETAGWHTRDPYGLIPEE